MYHTPLDAVRCHSFTIGAIIGRGKAGAAPPRKERHIPYRRSPVIPAAYICHMRDWKLSSGTVKLI